VIVPSIYNSPIKINTYDIYKNSMNYSACKQKNTLGLSPIAEINSSFIQLKKCEIEGEERREKKEKLKTAGFMILLKKC